MLLLPSSTAFTINPHHHAKALRLRYSGVSVPQDFRMATLFSTPPATQAQTPAQPVSSEQRELALHQLAQQVASCTLCQLCQTRTQTVFSDGNPHAKLMVIGEGPGQNEDETGIPFVGRAGQLLTQIIQSVGLSRTNDTYICNIVKCRPPKNRAPEPNEMAACHPYLMEQIHLIQPAIVLLAGATAVKGILDVKMGITKMRGQWFELPPERFGLSYTGQPIQAMPIFHPSYLLRNPQKTPGSPKALMWDDIRLVKTTWDALPERP